MTDSKAVAEVTIPHRFRGPPTSGNGGYSCGVIARHLEGPVRVRLRAAPPLDRPLAITARGAGLAMLDGQATIAEAEPTELDIDAPPAVTFAEAEAAAATSFAKESTSPYKSCFVCGPRDDGLRIFPGVVEQRSEPLYAAPWRPAEWTAGVDGVVLPQIVWAALDCPSGYATGGAGETLMVLGTLSASLLAPIHADERMIVIGWPIGRDGRKRASGSAIYDERGELRAVANAIWIDLDPSREGAEAGPPKASWT